MQTPETLLMFAFNSPHLDNPYNLLVPQPPKPAHPPTTTMEIDGITFNILHEGNPTHPLIILCHALMSNLHMWDSTVRALHAAGFSTLRYDHVGHGATTFPPTPASRVGSIHFDTFCAHIHSMVERTTPGRAPFGFIGCSMGGVLALRYAMLYPGQLKKVVSCDAPGMTSLEESKSKWRERIAMFEKEGVEALAKVTVKRWFPDPCPQGVREEAFRQTVTCSLAGYVTCAEGIMDYDYEEELEKVGEGEDVMVLAGENDEAIGPPEILADVARRVKGARHVVMPDTGHIPPMHQPEEFERIVIAFLKES
jgi:3-oxoadipate enol-lactonase